MPEGTFFSLIEEFGIQVDPCLLDLALTHRSHAYENGQGPHNERLEFLGDAVLGIVVTDHLYHSFPDYPEGRLAKIRSHVVSAISCAEVARSLRLGPMIKLGHGEITTGGSDKTSILADTTEAVIGAVYLSAGLPAASQLVHRLFDPLVERSARLGVALDWKTSLQELAAEHDLGEVSYLISESGPDHDKRFDAWACVGGSRLGRGHGRNKKRAEIMAAEQAFGTIMQDPQASRKPEADA